MRGLFITGTDTNVGKTVTAAAVMHRYRDHPQLAGPLRYWKPMQTGSDSDTAEVQRLGPCAAHEIFDRGIRLPLPASPHLAAEQAGVRIDLGALLSVLPNDDMTWIIEGAGGVLVPVNESQTMADWMMQLQLRILVVARTALGTINHTLLTLEALRSRNLRVAGVVMVGERNPANRKAIERYGDVQVLGEMPVLSPLDPNVLGQWSRKHFDPDARLVEFFMSDLLRRDRAHVWHPYTQAQTAPPLLPIARGEGVYLYTDDGRKVLDGISSWWVNIHGHAHPKLNAALAAQARELEHVVFAGCTHRPAVELAERLAKILPDGLTRIFYSDNGSTAVEAAVKMAVQYWRNKGERKRTGLIALDHAYHGDTVGAMSASAESVFTQAFAPLLFPVTRVHAPYCYRCPLGLERKTCKIDCLGSLEQQLKQHADSTAAVIVEPMLQGAGGMIVWPAEYLAGVRALCDRYDVLLIADEVLTGFGRTGRMFACEHADVRPDIMCLSKALTAGYLPMGVTAATEAIYAAFLSDDRSKTFFHGHSYTANPLACAVAIASLDLFAETNALASVERIEAQMQNGLAPLRALPHVGDVRVIGGIGAVELLGSGGYLDSIGPLLSHAFLERGLLLRPLGNIVYFMPPYVISEDETEWALEQIREVLSTAA